MTNPKISRGSALDADIRDEIERASPERRRRIAVAVAARALEASARGPEELDAALREIKTGSWTSATRDVVTSTAERLDDLYLGMYDDEKPGGRTAGWEEVFRKARGAAALGFAIDDDTRVAATEAVYEALHALDGDEEELRSTVFGTA